MPHGKPLPSAMLNDFITAVRPMVTEDAYGDLSSTENTDIATFWGDVNEDKSSTYIETGKIKSNHMVTITCRTRDIVGIEEDDHLTFGNSAFIWQVKEIYESDWKYGSTIIAEYITD